MRILITILLFFNLTANATNYYVDNAGSNANNGLSAGAAWQTLSKINSSTFIAGDSVFLKRGGVWNERLIIPSSNIYIGAYSTGEKPLITALQTVTGLTDSSHVWSASIPSSVANLNTVLVDGTIRARARFPNTGYFNFTSIGSYYQLNTPLSGTPNYSGADVVVRDASWILDRVRVSSQSGGVLTLRDPLTYNTAYANGYFFQNSISFLDIDGEWYFDSTNKIIKIYSTSLTAPSIQISNLDTLVWVSNKNNVTIDGIKITGANKAAFQVDSSRSVSITNCSINNSGSIGISALKSPLLNISNDSIQNSLSGGIYAANTNPYEPTLNTCDSALVEGNYLNYTAMFPGMGLSNNSKYFSAYVVGLNIQITKNIIDSSGYIPITLFGKKSLVKNNIVRNFCFVKDDGGGIYTSVGGYLPVSYVDSTRIVSNIIYNGIGGGYSGITVGIYLDDYARLVTIDSNTIFNTSDGIFLHDNFSNTVRNNWLYNNYISQFRMDPDVDINQDITFTGNKIYAGNSSKPFWIENGISSPSKLGTVNNNYYSHPVNENNIFNFLGSTYSLPAWRTYSGKDLNSTGTPDLITSASALLKYNATLLPQSYSLIGTYIDITGSIFNNSITLQPFTSAILFKSITDFIPTYQLKLRRIKR